MGDKNESKHFFAKFGGVFAGIFVVIGLVMAGLYASSDTRNYKSARCTVESSSVSGGSVSWRVTYTPNGHAASISATIEDPKTYDISQAYNKADDYRRDSAYTCYYNPDNTQVVSWSNSAVAYYIVMIVFLILGGILSVAVGAYFAKTFVYCRWHTSL